MIEIRATTDNLIAQLQCAANDWNAAVRALGTRGFDVSDPVINVDGGVRVILRFDVTKRVKVAL